MTRFIATIVAALSVGALGVAAAAQPASSGNGAIPEHCAKNCIIAFDRTLPGQGRLVGFDTTDVASHTHTGHLSYYIGGQLIDTAALPNEFGDGVEELREVNCADTARHCLISYGQGAHGGGVTAVELAPTTGIVFGDKRSADTGTVALADLDGDGTPDAAIRFSTYKPNFALAPLFWATLRNDDGSLTLTGCGVPSHDPKQPPPAQLLTEKCPLPGRSI